MVTFGCRLTDTMMPDMKVVLFGLIGGAIRSGRVGRRGVN